MKVTCEKSDCLIHTISLIIICLLLLTVISISCYYYYMRCWKKTNVKMGNKFIDIDIKSRTYFFFSDMININTFDPNEIKIEKSRIKIFLLYSICHG